MMKSFYMNLVGYKDNYYQMALVALDEFYMNLVGYKARYFQLEVVSSIIVLYELSGL